MNYRWMPPAAATVGFVGLMAMAKDSAPWPVYLGLVLAVLCCMAWTMVVHSRGVPPRAVTRAPPSR
jgi:hypothetical protein